MITHPLMLPIVIVFVSATWTKTPEARHSSDLAATATSANIACPAAESRQFDFWLGEWDLERSDGVRARVHVTSTHDGCVIQEDFDAAPASPLTGRSLASYDPQSHGWKQTWVDNHGSFFSFTGAFENDRMTLTAPYESAGKRSLHRRVWSAITADSFEWNWETSDDDGKTWRSAWRFTGRRSAPTSTPFTSPAKPASSTPSVLAPFAWLAGTWEGKLPNGMKADITYTQERAGTIAGVMRLTNAAEDTLVMAELIQLSTTMDGVTLRFLHFSRELRAWEDSATIMRFTGGSADSLHFVSTSGPRIDSAYLRRGPDMHVARSVIHHPDGREQIIEVPYRRRR